MSTSHDGMLQIRSGVLIMIGLLHCGHDIKAIQLNLCCESFYVLSYKMILCCMELLKAKIKAQTTLRLRLPVCEHVARQIKMKSRFKILVNTKVSAGSHESPCSVFCIVWK